MGNKKKKFLGAILKKDEGRKSKAFFISRVLCFFSSLQQIINLALNLAINIFDKYAFASSCFIYSSQIAAVL